MIDSDVVGTTRAEDAQGTPTQSHISPSTLVYEESESPLSGSGSRLSSQRGPDAFASLPLEECCPLRQTSRVGRHTALEIVRHKESGEGTWNARSGWNHLGIFSDECSRFCSRESCIRPCLVANRATLRQKVATPPPECGRFVSMDRSD